MVRLQSDPIDVAAVVASVSTPASGAVNLFLGTTRNHADGKGVVALSYEAYEEMAVQELEKIVREVHYHWPAHKVSIVHRLGSVPVGDVSVVVAVSSSHRTEAFESSRFIIDKLKERVPIWKKESFEDGTSVWSRSIHSDTHG